MGDTAFVTLHYTNGEKKMIVVGRSHGISAAVAMQFANDSTIVAIAYSYKDFGYSNSHSAVNATRRALNLYGITCRTREMDGVLYFLRDFYNTVFPL